MPNVSDMFKAELIAGNTPGHIAGFTVAVFLTMLLARITQWVFNVQLKRLAERSETRVDDVVIETLARPSQFAVLLFGARLSLQVLALPDWVDSFVGNSTTVAAAVLGAFTASRLVDAIYLTLVVPRVEKSDTRLDDQIVPIVMRACKVTIWVMAALITFSNLGYDIVSLLTGLGIGGLAVAMAAQDTLANVFGSVTIFADQPFQIGDLVEIAGHKGVVERGRPAHQPHPHHRRLPHHGAQPGDGRPRGHQLLHLRPLALRRQHRPGLRHSRRRAAPCRRGSRRAGQRPPHTEDGGSRFMEFGDSALGIGFAYFVTEPTAGRYLDAIADINLSIKERFDAEGWDMALPSQTVYIAGPVKVQMDAAAPTAAAE